MGSAELVFMLLCLLSCVRRTTGGQLRRPRRAVCAAEVCARAPFLGLQSSALNRITVYRERFGSTRSTAHRLMKRGVGR